ncbi:MAG TPA: hypothetical protein VK864_11920 [Longimicrobiales bacterium]|nr:hypothetical protein [Longimicrobiales bacterium]
MDMLLTIPRTAISARRLPPRVVNPDEMLMDRQTYADLEVFEAEGDAPSLFDLLNRTRTTGGSKVLHRRMRRPWSNVDHIRTAQQSLRFIMERRALFDALPTESTISAIEQYLYSGLAMLAANNRFEAVLESIEIRIGESRDYWRVLGGVRHIARVIRTLKQMVGRPELANAPGELSAFIEEIRSLVTRPAFAPLPSDEARPPWCWKTMRMDQMLRLDERAAVERILRLIFELDALVSMADTVTTLGFVMPEVRAGPVEVVAEGVYHPFLREPVTNALRLDQTRRLLFLTGPNMAGKTTYLRACGTAVYLAHLGMGVPARSFRFAPCDSLFSAISLADNVREGVSFFRAEALRVKTIAEAVAAGRRVIALLDEPFMGTNVKDALDASGAILTRLAAKEGSVFLVSSHLIELGDTLAATGTVDCKRFEADESGERLEFDYLLRSGISSQRLGVRVLQEEGVFDLLDAAVTSGPPPRFPQ